MAPPTATEPQGAMDTQIATFSDKLSVNGVPARRSKGLKFGGGIAAHASSDMFKNPVMTSASSTAHSFTDKALGIREAEGKEMGSYVRIINSSRTKRLDLRDGRSAE